MQKKYSGGAKHGAATPARLAQVRFSRRYATISKLDCPKTEPIVSFYLLNNG
jgi:hypothetical protein